MPPLRIPRRLITVLIAGVLTLVPAAISAQDATPVASPEPLPEPTIAATAGPVTGADGAWVVTAFDAWQTGLSEPLPESLLRLSFQADARLQGETACGRFEGGWSSQGSELYASILPGGTFNCPEEQAGEAIGLSTALDSVVAWQADDIGGIELLDAAGSTRLVLQPLNAGDPAGSWLVSRFRRPNGEWAGPVPEGPMELNLLPGGLLEGGTGCRLLLGLYRYDAGDITIGPFETDGLPCDGQLARAERRLLRALGEATTWQQAGDTLTLSSETEAVVELARVPEGGE